MRLLLLRLLLLLLLRRLLLVLLLLKLLSALTRPREVQRTPKASQLLRRWLRSWSRGQALKEGHQRTNLRPRPRESFSGRGLAFRSDPPAELLQHVHKRCGQPGVKAAVFLLRTPPGVANPRCQQVEATHFTRRGSHGKAGRGAEPQSRDQTDPSKA